MKKTRPPFKQLRGIFFLAVSGSWSQEGCAETLRKKDPVGADVTPKQEAADTGVATAECRFS